MPDPCRRAHLGGLHPAPWALGLVDELGCVVFEPFDRLDLRRQAAASVEARARARP